MRPGRRRRLTLEGCHRREVRSRPVEVLVLMAGAAVSRKRPFDGAQDVPVRSLWLLHHDRTLSCGVKEELVWLARICAG